MSSLVCKIILIIHMLQLLYFLRNTPMVIPPKVFCEGISIFRMLLQHRKAPRVKLKQLQRPKNEGSLAMPNPWLYYMAAQLQDLIGSINKPRRPDAHLPESTVSMGSMLSLSNPLPFNCLRSQPAVFYVFILVTIVWCLLASHMKPRIIFLLRGLLMALNDTESYADVMISTPLSASVYYKCGAPC